MCISPYINYKIKIDSLTLIVVKYFDRLYRNKGFPGKVSAQNVGDLGSIPGLRRSPGEGNDYPLQYSGLENSMDYISPRSLKESDLT